MTKTRREDLLPYLGKVPDIEIAERFGISRERVRQYRKKYGIPKYEPEPKFTPELINCLGKMSDKEVAEQFNLSASVVTYHRNKLGIPPFDPVAARHAELDQEVLKLLGKLSDPKIAERLGLTTAVVYNIRKRLKIKVDERRATRWRPAFNWTPETDALLGTKYDFELAEELGIKEHIVTTRRRKLGITAYRNKKNG